MRILMLGWEFPPFIAGGLGTACYGLTRALDRLGHEVVFVLPKPVDKSHASHVQLRSPDDPPPAPRSVPGKPVRIDETGGSSVSAPAGGSATADAGERTERVQMPGFEHAEFRPLPAAFSSPYPAFGDGPGQVAGLTPEEAAQRGVSVSGVDALGEQEGRAVVSAMGGYSVLPMGAWAAPASGSAAYDGDMFQHAERYARLVVSLARHERFDVIHAHDWMTYPAGLAVASVSGKPLVAHIHSTEFDRSGQNVNQQVYDVERRGLHGAVRVIAVSMLTRSICTRHYGVESSKIDVVYNGIDNESAQPQLGPGIQKKDKIVLFLGRITMQKGPEYFIRAAKRVLEKIPEAKFVVAGSGDMTVRMIEEAAWNGIGHRVLFTGFLRGPDVDRIFRMADCYVMPSVSEPFGIAPLEAMRNDVPVIISKQSGVSEVLSHALKVDFWDVDEMANKIVAVLKHPPLGQTLREHGSFELRKLTWDGAAERCVQSYTRSIDMIREHPVVF